MASNHQSPSGGFTQVTLWNEKQEKMLKELEDAGQGSIDACLQASFTFEGGICKVKIKGKATRNVTEEHPAYQILNREGIGTGATFDQAVKVALIDR